MPPLFRQVIRINDNLLANLRELPVRAQRVMRRRFIEELAPELQEDLSGLMESGPQVSSPFEFGTQKSAAFYFWLVRSNPDLSDGEHWIRHPEDPDSVEGGFRLTFSDRLRGEMIKIANINTKAKFVFGPWLVAGHRNTGWPEHAEIVRQLLREKAHDQIHEMWQQSVREALRER